MQMFEQYKNDNNKKMIKISILPVDMTCTQTHTDNMQHDTH